MHSFIRRSGIQLCYPLEEKRLLRWHKPYIVQPKLDGDRCRAIYDHELKTWTLLSSEQNVITMLPHITDALMHDIRSSIRLEFDGELYIHNVPHELIHGIVSRKVNAHKYASEIEYHIFDIINNAPQIERCIQLRNLQSILKEDSPIKVVPSFLVNDMPFIMRHMDNFVEAGYEGIIVRNTDGYYERKRSTNIMKFKPSRSDIYTIIGLQEEIDQYGVAKGTLGAFICTSDEGTSFNVGTGFSADQRREYWKLGVEYFVGKRIEVKYQHLTAQKGVPRFPVFAEVL